MTEDQAKEKWCPFVRLMSFEGQIYTNREDYLHGPVGEATRCIASDCMMWRWRQGEGMCGLRRND